MQRKKLGNRYGQQTKKGSSPTMRRQLDVIV